MHLRLHTNKTTNAYRHRHYVPLRASYRINVSYVHYIQASWVKQGRLNHSQLHHIWRPPKYRAEDHEMLLNLLRTFDIVYTVRGENEV